MKEWAGLSGDRPISVSERNLMGKPICVRHMRELTCVQNGTKVYYPNAERVYHADVWECRDETCDVTVAIRTDMPSHEIYMGTFREAVAQSTLEMEVE